MSTLIWLVSLLAAGVVLVRVVCVAAHLSRRNFNGHPLQFLALSASYALLAGGATGTVLHLKIGPLMLLVGVALWVVFDRRRGAC